MTDPGYLEWYSPTKQLSVNFSHPATASTCRLQCPFIDIPSSMMLDDGRRFNDDQIALAMHELIQSIQHRSSFVKPWHIAESIEPDIRSVVRIVSYISSNFNYLCAYFICKWQMFTCQ